MERGFEVAALQPAAVDLGEFGGQRVAARQPAPYPLKTARLFPTRPYPYGLYLGGVVPLLRSFRPEVLYVVGEPSELSVAQTARLSRRVSPDTRIVLYSFENLGRRWSGFPRRLRGRAERATWRRLDLIAAASEGARQFLTRSGFDPARIRLLPLGSDEKLFHRQEASALRAEWGVGAEDYLVGYAGRLVYEKGVDVLLEALAGLPPRFRLAVVGGGRYEGELRSLAARLQIEERIRWMGRLPASRMPLFYSACDSLVLPSRSIPDWQEQFGLVLIEAMLCETPVIGSSCGAIPEVIGEAGLIFPEGDAGALADRLARLAGDATLKDELAQAGRERALQRYTTGRYFDGMAEIIREAAALPPRIV
jgi:glycosyltransferase involved in cell wall biosynthesis